MSIADYIFADVTDVSGQDNTNACECISSISFEQRTLKSRGDYERKAVWSREVLAEHLFSTLFQHACLVTCFHFCTVHTDDRQPFTLHSLLVVRLAQDRVKRKEFPWSSACSIVSWCLVCSGMHARYTDAFNGSEQSPVRHEQSVKLPVTLVVREQWLLWRHTDGGCGCYPGYRTQGYIALWLERLTADQQVPGSIPGGGQGLSSCQDPTI